MPNDFLDKMTRQTKQELKKKKGLLTPNPLEQELQRTFMSVISSVPSKEKVKEKILPEIKHIEKKIKERRSKTYLRRVLKE